MSERELEARSSIRTPQPLVPRNGDDLVWTSEGRTVLVRKWSYGWTIDGFRATLDADAPLPRAGQYLTLWIRRAPRFKGWRLRIARWLGLRTQQYDWLAEVIATYVDSSGRVAAQDVMSWSMSHALVNGQPLHTAEAAKPLWVLPDPPMPRPYGMAEPGDEG